MESILFEIKNNVAHLTLNRPEKFNAFNREMALLLQSKLDECESNTEIRAVLLTGAGKAFCAGQDLAEVIDPNGPGMNRILSEHFNPLVMKIRNLSKPIVCAVNGVAAGAGANLAFCCDITVAASSVHFIQAFTKIGLIPDSGGTFMLPRLIGWQKATALMLLGDKVNAADAEKMGMIYKEINDEELLPQALAIAETLAKMPTKALAYTKKALHSSLLSSLEEQLHTEDVLQQKAAATSDFKEGVAAFIEKRKPVFTGI
jgi:2-(1,2-epoxy-1,2-dihydrophenyl)acetyl-CoA isomerase